MRNVHVRIAQHHRQTRPSAQVHEHVQVAVFLIVPRRPGVATIVRVKVADLGARARRLESFLDTVAGRHAAVIVRIERAVRLAEQLDLSRLLLPSGTIQRPGLRNTQPSRCSKLARIATIRGDFGRIRSRFSVKNRIETHVGAEGRK